MGHEWKIGDWAEANGNRYFVYRVVGSSVFGVMESGTPSWDIACKAKHLPDCTGWDWEPTQAMCVNYGCAMCMNPLDGGTKCEKCGFELQVEQPTSRKWEFGDWAMTHIGNNLRFVSVDSDGDFMFVEKSGDISAFNAEFLVYLPECTGFDWTPPSPVKQIEPPTGYRLLGRDEVVADGDLFIKRAPAGNDYDWRTASVDHLGTTVGYLVDIYHIACFARKIEPRYRPFANAAEFAPHRDRWVRLKSDTSMQMRVVCYNDRVVWIESDRVTGNRYGYVFDRFVFEDGTPFGVLDTNE